MSNILGYYNNEKTKVSETKDENINMPVVFVRNANRQNQNLLIDSPNELFYNPSTKTLHADNFSGGIPSLVAGEAIELTTANNSTEIDVNFTKNTEVVTSILDNDTFLVSNTSNSLKTITGALLKTDIRLTAGDNLEYGSGINSNKLSLKGALTNTSLNTGTSWNGNLIVATKLSDGSVSDTEFQRLNGITSAILETSDKNTANGVCGLDANGIISNAQLPSSVNDIIEVANFASLPNTGESSKIYVTLDNHKAYRWGGTEYVEISASLVIGTTSGTAYDGSSGQANSDNIALKQNILVDSATSGILIDGSNNIDIDLTRTTAETSFDDNELMLIQKTNGSLCRLTKQQLKSSINTNTEYNNGTNITIDSNNDINLNSALTGLSSVTSTDFVGSLTGNSTTSTKITSITNSNIVQLNETQTLTNKTLNNPNILTNCNIEATSGFASLEIGGASGALIDLKKPFSDDYDLRMIHDGTSKLISKSSLILQTNDTDAITIDTSQNSTFVGNISIATGKTYKINGTDLSGANLNYSAGVTINAEIDSKQDTLNFGKSIGNALKLQDAVVTNDVLVMGSSNVIGKTYSELKSLLSLNNVENIAVSTLGGTNLTFSSNKLNLDSALTGLSSVTSTNFVGSLTGNSSTSTKISSINNSDIVQLNETQTLTNKSLTSPTVTGVLNFTGSKLDINPTSGNAVLQLHSNAGRYTINAEQTNGDFQIYDNDNGRSVFRYFQATQSITINSDLNLSSGFKYKINGVDITDTTYNNGSNITIDGSNNINLDTTLENVNSIESSTNTDLKLESNGSGAIRLIATPNDSTNGYIHLCRANAPTERFNTIEYSVNGNSSFINFLVHYTAGANNLTRQVLKLNSNLSSEFSGSVFMKQSCSIQADAAYGSLEIGGPSGGFIDLKSPFSDDFDFRIITTNASTELLSKSIITVKTNDVLAMTINANQNVGIGNSATANFKLYVSGGGHFGDAFDATKYGQLQITRDATQPVVGGNIGHYISMIRAGAMVSGMGYKQSSNIMYIKNEFYENTTSNGIYIDANKIGINKESPTQALDVTGNIFSSAVLDCMSIQGGRNNLADNFHIDNYSNAGVMHINHTNQRDIYFGNSFYTLFDLSSGTHKIIVQHNNSTQFTRIIMDFFKRNVGTDTETQIGKIEYNGQNTFYRATSDIRTKENIKPIIHHYDVLDKLNPCSFKVKTCDLPPIDGFIADELYDSYPICTSGKPGGIKEDGSPDLMMIDTKPLIPILTKCIQGNRQEIKDLKLENDKLKNKVDELELKLNLIYEKLNISYI